MGSLEADCEISQSTPEGSQLAFSRGEAVLVRSIEDWDQPPRVLGRHDRKVWNLVFHPSGERVAAFDESLERFENGRRG